MYVSERPAPVAVNLLAAEMNVDEYASFFAEKDSRKNKKKRLQNTSIFLRKEELLQQYRI